MASEYIVVVVLSGYNHHGSKMSKPIQNTYDKVDMKAIRRFIRWAKLLMRRREGWRDVVVEEIRIYRLESVFNRDDILALESHVWGR